MFSQDNRVLLSLFIFIVLFIQRFLHFSRLVFTWLCWFQKKKNTLKQFPEILNTRVM